MAPPSTPPVPAGPETLGAVAVALAWDWTSWVNRRVETIEFVEDTTIRRAMSIDFTLPEVAALAAPVQPDAWIAVPLEIIAKKPLMHLDVIDEQRASLSTLNTLQNSELAGHGLALLFDAIAAQSGQPPVTVATRDRLEELVRAPVIRATQIRDELLAPGAELNRLLRVGTRQERLEVRLIRELTAGFMLLVQVQYEPGRNRVVKFAYDVEHRWDDRRPGSIPADDDRGLRSIPARFLRGLGALPRRRTFVLRIGRAQGHHVEVVAPEDTEIIAAKLEGRQWSTETSARVPFALDAQAGSRSRSHAYVSLLAGREGAADAAEQRGKQLSGRSDRAEFTVAIAPRRAGVVAVATIMAIFTALTLALFASRLADLDGQTSAAVLLLVPAIFAAYVSRAGEHPFATRSLFGIRVFALVGGVLAAVLCAMIGAGLTKPQQPSRAQLARVLRCVAPDGSAGAPGAALRLPLACTLRPTSSRQTRAEPEVGPVAAGVATVLAWLGGFVALILLTGYAIGELVRRAAKRVA